MVVFAQSHDRIAKERAMRKRQLKRLWARLAKLSSMKLSREARYLLRTNLTSSEPAELRRYYIQLVHVEQTFKDLKGDLAVRPIHH